MIGKYDVKTGAQVEYVGSDEGHRGEITDIQMSPDGTYFITSSKDKTARVCLSLPFPYFSERWQHAQGIHVGAEMLRLGCKGLRESRRQACYRGIAF